jgi:sugar lactone lactonase YvrE
MPTRIAALRPPLAIEGGRVSIDGGPFSVTHDEFPLVRVGSEPARTVWAGRSRVVFAVPPGVGGGAQSVRIDQVPGETAFLETGTRVATGLHQVDSPVIDAAGTVYLTYSGSRGQQSPVSIFRVPPGGAREVFVTGITNPTSMALDDRGHLYVSSRFDGTVFRVDEAGVASPFASELGVACGLAFGPDGVLFVGDRTGTVFRVSPAGEVSPFVSLPASVAAFHLASAPGGVLYATGPTMSARDAVYRIDPDGNVHVVTRSFGRPQGLACDAQGRLYVVEALAGTSGIYRVDPDGATELVVAGAGLIGLAFDPLGGFVVTTSDSAYRFRPSSWS